MMERQNIFRTDAFILLVCILSITSAFNFNANPLPFAGKTRRIFQTHLQCRDDVPFLAFSGKSSRRCSLPGKLCMSSDDGKSDEGVPQSWVSATSTKEDFGEALEEAVRLAKDMLPPEARTDLAIVHYSSIYSNMYPVQTELIPLLSKLLPDVKTMLGSSAAGVLGAQPGSFGRASEVENRVGVTVTLASLPNVKIHPYHLTASDLPKGDANDEAWRDTIGLTIDKTAYDIEVPPVFLSFPTASFINDLNDYMTGIDYGYPAAAQIGGIASTVSSLSRSTVFVIGTEPKNEYDTGFYGEGVVGVALHGDLRIRSIISQGSTPIGELIYEVDQCEGGMIKAIRTYGGEKQVAPPVPPMYEIAMLKKSVGVRERSMMQRNLLVGLSSTVGRSVNEFINMATDPKDLNFLVQNVGYVDMKTGSITVTENVKQGQKLRFFVRDREAAIDDLNANLMRYKLTQLQGSLDDYSSKISGALVFPSLDRGRVLFEEENYESKVITDFVNAPMGGFFCNGAIGSLGKGSPTTLFGSTTIVTLMLPASDATPVGGYNTQTKAEEKQQDEDEELVVRRKDPLTARPIKGGQVEYSVVEKLAQPKNRLEAIVWEKEGEVEKAREFYPLKSLVFQTKVYMADKSNSFYDFVASIKESATKPLPVIAECKKTTPVVGSLRDEYNPMEIAQAYQQNGAAAVAVHCDRKFFGGSMNDMQDVKSVLDIPVLCSDFIIFPYQIYKAKCSGADAIQLISSILPESDLPYFHKIAKAIGMQVVVCVNTKGQMERALEIEGLQAVSIIQRDIVDWSPSDQASKILTDDIKKQLAERDILLLVEGGINSKEDIRKSKEMGVDAVIVGTSLLQQIDPGTAIVELLGLDSI